MDLSTVYLLAVPLFFVSVGGLALFFGSDYAQRKWNPDYCNCRQKNNRD